MKDTNIKSPLLDIKKIMEILPHRYPFLLVDKVLEIDSDTNTIVAVKNVTMNEDFFQGHFPGEPIMPGVLIVEALAQAGAILAYQTGIRGLFVLSSIKKVKFRRMVKPGDVLRLEVSCPRITKRGGRSFGCAKVDGELAAEVEIFYAIAPDGP